MNTPVLTPWARANAAFRNNDFESAVMLYEEAISQAAEPLKARICINRDIALRRLGMTPAQSVSTEVTAVIDELEHKKIRASQYKHTNDELANPNADFDAAYYLTKYNDLLFASVEPYAHYIAHGKAEGRQGTFDLASIATPGLIEYNPEKQTILVVCHEASRTGAPILGLRIAESLANRYNVVVWLAGRGPLVGEFKKQSFLLINHTPDYADILWALNSIKSKYNLAVGILNSVATSNFSSAMFELKLPSVALIHEYADYMGSQVMQVLATANRVVFPAKGVKQSADDLCLKSLGSLPKATVIRNQGMCILPSGEDGKLFSKESILFRLGIKSNESKPSIVMGCGWVQMRKGVEYFIHAAQLCKQMTDKPMRFIWIGGGFNPSDDLYYSAWLQSQIKHSGLEDDLFFFEETKDLSPFFELADVFFLSSRLDPFPNVAIDAVKARVPIVAFERATGFTDFMDVHPKVGVSVPYLNAHAAAEAILDLAKSGKVCCSESEQAAIDKALSFADYMDFLVDQCQIAIKQQQEIATEAEFLEKSQMMTPGFYRSGIPNYKYFGTWTSVHTVLDNLSDEYIYVARWARGIPLAKSRVGFSDAIADRQFVEDGSTGTEKTPLARWINGNKPLHTHRMLNLSLDRREAKFSSTIKLAVHIHAYYVDELHVLLNRMQAILPHADFFITTTSDDKLSAVLDICRWVSETHGISFIPSVKVTPNVGRDVGPFIMTLKESLMAYDVVGHFHLKGTKQLEKSIVQQWQNFLFDSLLGSEGEVAIEIIEQFAQDPKLGLVFQEDPCLLSWGQNYEYALGLATELGFADHLPEIPEYPTGNMFWVRPAALSALLKKDWQWTDFPQEPVPYDGTLLHAIERITPAICESSGFYWMTSRNPASVRFSDR